MKECVWILCLFPSWKSSAVHLLVDFYYTIIIVILLQILLTFLHVINLQSNVDGQLTMPTRSLSLLCSATCTVHCDWFVLLFIASCVKSISRHSLTRSLGTHSNGSFRFQPDPPPEPCTNCTYTMICSLWGNSVPIHRNATRKTQVFPQNIIRIPLHVTDAPTTQSSLA